MLWSPTDIESKLKAELPLDSQIDVIDLTGTRDHYEVRIVSTAFEGKTPLERHRMVYAILGQDVGGPIHALSIKASTP